MPPAQNTVVMFQLRDDPKAAKRQARTLLVVYAAAMAAMSPLLDDGPCSRCRASRWPSPAA